MFCCSLDLVILDALHRIANHRQSLSREEARAVMTEVLTGQCSDAQIAALLVALHMKGETVEEIVGFAEAIRAAAIPLELHAELRPRRQRHRARRAGRHLRHRRRCQRHLQHFDGDRLRRCRSRRARRQARQSQRDLEMRLRRRDGSAGREHQPAARALAACLDKSESRFSSLPPCIRR